MMTRSAGRQTAAPRGGRTDGRTSKEGGRIGEPIGRVGGQTGDQDGQRDTEFWCHTTVGAGHAAYIDRFHELARLVPNLVTLENKRTERNGSLRKNTEKRGIGGELSRDGNVRDDTKRSRTGRAFATTTNLVRREYTGTEPKAGPRLVTPLNARNPITTRGVCFEYGSTHYYKAACPQLNRAPRQGGNRQNQVMAIEGGKND
ncbi:hypothetical protein Tco_1240220 [Tanacetum coccineum]